MNEITLVDQATKADDIAKEAFTHFDAANRLSNQIQLASKETGKIGLIAVGVVGAFFILASFSLIRYPDQFIFGLGLGVGLIGVAIGIYNSSEKSRKNRLQELIPSRNWELSEGNRIFNENISILGILPQEYWYPLATDYIKKMLQTNRASTINEALSMFDEQLHRWRMENMQSQALQAQAYQTSMMRNIQINSAVSAAASVAGLFK